MAQMSLVLNHRNRLLKTLEMLSAHSRLTQKSPSQGGLGFLNMLYVYTWTVSLCSYPPVHWPEGQCADSLNSVHNPLHIYGTPTRARRKR